MDTLSAFTMGQATRHKDVMVFDWNKAAFLMRKEMAKDANAGLRDDWEWTGGQILCDGQPLPREETYTYLASTWATPQLQIGEMIFDCFILQKDSPGWTADTYWPESAFNILNGGVNYEG